MAAYRRVYDSPHLHADCQEPGLAPEPCARQSSMDYLYLFTGTELIHLSAVHIMVACGLHSGLRAVGSRVAVLL